jgi:uncharacterized coiled-coil protein SlyX
MTDDGPDSIVLRYLRRIDERTERMERRLDELTVRTGRLEELGAGLHVDVAAPSVRLDRLDVQMRRVERRLELHESEPA